MIALALLADTQVTRAVHEEDEARADARAELEARLRQEAAERARQEEAARRAWGEYDARHHNAVNAVRASGTGIVSGSVLAGILALALMILGVWICTTLRLVFPTTFEEADYYRAVNGIGHAINGWLWLMILVAIVCGVVARWAPVATWLTVAVIGWAVYKSAPAASSPGGIGFVFSDLVLDLGMVSVLLFTAICLGLFWILALTYGQADRARESRLGLEKAQENLRGVEANPPSVPRPAPVSGLPS